MAAFDARALPAIAEAVGSADRARRFGCPSGADVCDPRARRAGVLIGRCWI